MFRPAEPEDLADIVRIYNQSIDSRTITADLSPASVADRQAWFDFHRRHPRYPLWVCEQRGQIAGWCGCSPFYPRPAYDGTAEISFYLDRAFHGQGLGRQSVQFLIGQMPALQLHTLLAFVFGGNAPSLSLLERSGFAPWGRLPQVADMQNHFEDLVILGYQRPLPPDTTQRQA